MAVQVSLIKPGTRINSGPDLYDLQAALFDGKVVCLNIKGHGILKVRVNLVESIDGLVPYNRVNWCLAGETTDSEMFHATFHSGTLCGHFTPGPRTCIRMPNTKRVCVQTLPQQITNGPGKFDLMYALMKGQFVTFNSNTKGKLRVRVGINSVQQVDGRIWCLRGQFVYGRSNSFIASYHTESGLGRMEFDK